MASDDYKIQRLSEQEFFAAEDRWQDLLRRSDGNPLFGSWYWASSWWQQMSVTYAGGSELCVIALVAQDQRWLALAPCHIVTTRRRGLRVRSLHMLGTGPPAINLFRSEYLSLLIDQAEIDRLLPVIIRSLETQANWDEALIGDVPSNSALSQCYATHLPTGWFSREINQDTGYRVDLRAGIEPFVAGLSASARRQMFNKRERLAQRGQLRLRTADEITLGALAETLNRFHRRRFDNDVVRAEHAAFLRALTAHDGPGAPRLAHSLLEIDNTPISALLDIDVNRTRHNIQLGFDASFDQALSPGVLHLGYAIEQAADAKIDCYDLLIGAGLTHDYKARFATNSQSIATLHWVRAPWLRFAHRLYQRLRHRHQDAERTGAN